MNYVYRRSCDVHGILLLDKPKGISSNGVLQVVKRIYKANHAGHTGTLDPIATGMLPICFGEATKFSQYLLDSDKRYRVIAKLGQKTDTSDSDGQIIQERAISFSEKQFNETLSSFLGNIFQIPSMYSALRFRGKRLYEYARRGIEVPRKPRKITVYELLCTRYEKEEIELEIHCSKGTYVRTIIDDLGEKLGCGAHVIYLRRLSMSNYKAEHMVTLEELKNLVEKARERDIHECTFLYSLLMPIDSLAFTYPIVNLPLELSFHVKNGQPVHVTDLSLKGLVCITEGEEGTFIGIGRVDEKGYITPHRLVFKYLIQ